MAWSYDLYLLRADMLKRRAAAALYSAILGDEAQFTREMVWVNWLLTEIGCPPPWAICPS